MKHKFLCVLCGEILIKEFDEIFDMMIEHFSNRHPYQKNILSYDKMDETMNFFVEIE